MNKEETAAIMGKIRLGDNRNYGDTPKEQAVYLTDWHEKIGDLDFQDAWDAVTMHFRDSDEYLRARHIRKNVARIRDDRERAARKQRPALAAQRVTLDRAAFEAETAKAIEAARAERATP